MCAEKLNPEDIGANKNNVESGPEERKGAGVVFGNNLVEDLEDLLGNNPKKELQKKLEGLGYWEKIQEKMKEQRMENNECEILLPEDNQESESDKSASVIEISSSAEGTIKRDDLNQAEFGENKAEAEKPVDMKEVKVDRENSDKKDNDVNVVRKKTGGRKKKDAGKKPRTKTKNLGDIPGGGQAGDKSEKDVKKQEEFNEKVGVGSKKSEKSPDERIRGKKYPSTKKLIIPARRREDEEETNHQPIVMDREIKKPESGGDSGNVESVMVGIERLDLNKTEVESEESILRSKIEDTLANMAARKIDYSMTMEEAIEKAEQIDKNLAKNVPANFFVTNSPDVTPSESLAEEKKNGTKAVIVEEESLNSETNKPDLKSGVSRILTDEPTNQILINKVAEDEICPEIKLENKLEKDVDLEKVKLEVSAEDNDGVVIDFDPTGIKTMEVVGSEVGNSNPEKKEKIDLTTSDGIFDFEISKEGGSPSGKIIIDLPDRLKVYKSRLDPENIIPGWVDDEKTMTREEYEAKFNEPYPMPPIKKIRTVDNDITNKESGDREAEEAEIISLEDLGKSAKSEPENKEIDDKTGKKNLSDVCEEVKENEAKEKIVREKARERMTIYRSALDSLAEMEKNLNVENIDTGLRANLLKTFALVQDDLGKYMVSYHPAEENNLSVDGKYIEISYKNMAAILQSDVAGQGEREKKFLDDLQLEIKNKTDEVRYQRARSRRWVRWAGMVPVLGQAVQWGMARYEGQKIQDRIGLEKDIPGILDTNKIPEEYREFFALINCEVNKLEAINDTIYGIDPEKFDLLTKVARRWQTKQKTSLSMLENIEDENGLKEVLENIRKNTAGLLTKLIEKDNKEHKSLIIKEITRPDIEKISRLVSVCAGLTAEKNYQIKKNAVKDSLAKKIAKKLDNFWFGRESKITGLVTYVGGMGAVTYAGYTGLRYGLGIAGLGAVGGAIGMDRLLQNTKKFNTRLRKKEVDNLSLQEKVVNLRADNIIYRSDSERIDGVIGIETAKETEEMIRLIKMNKDNDYQNIEGWRQDYEKNTNLARGGIDKLRSKQIKTDWLRRGVAALAGLGGAWLFHHIGEWWQGGHTDVDPNGVPLPVQTPSPTAEPTIVPTAQATAVPTVHPTEAPTVYPTVEPTLHPTEIPTVQPTMEPTSLPTVHPTEVPTAMPTVEPTHVPTVITSSDESFAEWLQGVAEGKAETHEETIENIQQLYFNKTHNLSLERVTEYCQAMEIDCPPAVQHFIEENAGQFSDDQSGHEALRLVLNNTHIIHESTDYTDLMSVLNEREETISEMAGLFNEHGILSVEKVVDYCRHYGENHATNINIYIDQPVRHWFDSILKSDNDELIRYFSDDYNGYRHLRLLLNNTNLISDQFSPGQIIKIAQVLERFDIKATMFEGLGDDGKFLLMQQILNNNEILWQQPELMTAVRDNIDIGSQLISDYVYKYDCDWLKLKEAYNL